MTEPTPRPAETAAAPPPAAPPPAAQPPAARASHYMRPPAAWRTSLREFAIIVAGVLAALGAQALWEHFQERELERDYLLQLVTDARENAARLDAAIAEDSAAHEASVRMLHFLERDTPGVTRDSVVVWLNAIGTSSEFQPVTGTHRALLETGDLRVVRSDAVRSALVSYATSLDRETARIEQLRGELIRMVPDLARLLPFMRLVFSGGPDVDRLDVAALQRDEDLPVLVFAMQAANVNRIGGLRRMRDATLELIAVLDSARGDAARADTAR